MEAYPSLLTNSFLQPPAATGTGVIPPSQPASLPNGTAVQPPQQPSGTGNLPSNTIPAPPDFTVPVPASLPVLALVLLVSSVSLSSCKCNPSWKGTGRSTMLVKRAESGV
ncbi:hypothetical protein D8B26_008412 [Coccidioides posadasii str. Silveira]|uniref:uncharacterized protein n=1 Tax=Coccidioides posadasii (strain RMSCC 757 / Silveira) TaxID=443226 RepID=UPI001BF0A5EC|nr:hypothetical protein D8B26_008412 [Coccidioides posadasii str. Silveira]